MRLLFELLVDELAWVELGARIDLSDKTVKDRCAEALSALATWLRVPQCRHRPPRRAAGRTIRVPPLLSPARMRFSGLWRGFPRPGVGAVATGRSEAVRCEPQGAIGVARHLKAPPSAPAAVGIVHTYAGSGPHPWLFTASLIGATGTGLDP
jgi:hypothetical protein